MEHLLFTGMAAFAGGACLGSFFNVVIHRFPRGESVVFPGSHCPVCNFTLPWRDNIPLLSWLWLRGRCRSCRAPISPRYPAIELLTGLLALLLLLGWQHLPEIPLDRKIGICWLALICIPIFIIDFRHFLIPDLLLWPGALLGLGVSFLPGGLTPAGSLAGAGVAGGLLWGVRILAARAYGREALGFGDVKLLAMGGALFGLGIVLPAFFAGAIIGLALCALWCLRLLPRWRWRKSRMWRLLGLCRFTPVPLGPPLCLGMLAAAVWNEPFLNFFLP